MMNISSCGKGDAPIEGVIERDKFVEVLIDVQISESMNQFIRNKESDYNLDFSYQWIYEKHGINEEIFRTSIEYYTEDPETFEAIYDEVIIRISEKKIEYIKKPE